MRLCSVCQKEDKPWFESDPCSCGQPAHDDDPSPLKHDPGCQAVGHEVLLYPARMPLSEFTYVAGEPVLNPEWKRKGWVLMRDGQRYYREKMLCRACIEIEEDTQAQMREYEKACREARGLDNQTYAQMLASQ